MIIACFFLCFFLVFFLSTNNIITWCILKAVCNDERSALAIVVLVIRFLVNVDNTTSTCTDETFGVGEHRVDALAVTRSLIIASKQYKQYKLRKKNKALPILV